MCAFLKWEVNKYQEEYNSLQLQAQGEGLWQNLEFNLELNDYFKNICHVNFFKPVGMNWADTVTMQCYSPTICTKVQK